MPRIFVFHPVKHQRAVECGLVAQSHVAVLIGDFSKPSRIARRSASLSFGSSLMISDALTVTI
jgi:hypothetical protein